jgi:hypothetical protein
MQAISSPSGINKICDSMHEVTRGNQELGLTSNQAQRITKSKVWRSEGEAVVQQAEFVDRTPYQK